MPQAANVIRVQNVLQGLSGLPEDRYINTFHFVCSSPEESADPIVQGIVRDQVRAFFNTVQTGNTVAVGARISSGVSRAADASEVRSYNLNDPEPRESIIDTYTLVAPTVAGGLPSEVAVSLSYYGGRNLASRRGRVFIGPLTTNVTDGGNPPRVSSAFRDILLNAAADALIPSLVGNPKWVVNSETTGQVWVISDAWVDNAFDTIRSRGEQATSRSEIAIPQP